jgi:hypothetical protein
MAIARPSGLTRNPIAMALWVNAILLGGILVVMLSRGNGPTLLPAAFGQNQPPIAGGAGVFIMPGQLGTNQFGCYLLDVDAKTIVVYQYEPQPHRLNLVASRGYDADRFLHDFSTAPPTAEIRRLVDREKQGPRKRDDNVPPENPEKPKE